MISTKNIKASENSGGNFVKPILGPGNHKVTILSIELKPEKDRERFGDALVLRLMGPALEGFKGFAINKDKPEEGNYTGQVGWVNYSRWSFRDFVTESGFELSRDNDLLVAIKTICEELGIAKWFDDADGKYATVDALIEGFNKEAPFKGIEFEVCLYGREYSSLSNGKSYINYQLFLPRQDRTLGKPFSRDKSKVITFFESAGIERLKPATTDTASKTKDGAINIKQGSYENGKTVTASTDGPTKITPSSQAEANFLNDGKKSVEQMNNAEFLADLQGDQKDEPAQDIVVDNSSEKLPWE